MSAPAHTADAQLERLLYILPVAARGPVRVEEIARALGVGVDIVLRDLETATARTFYHPAGAVESFSITTDGDTVQVHAPQEFRRPARLSAREALVVGLALRTLAADADEPRRAQILELAARLERHLAAPDVGPPSMIAGEALPDARIPYAARYDVEGRDDAAVDAGVAAGAGVEHDVEYDEFALAFDDDGFRGVVADAIELRRTCTIWYLKPGERAPAHRRIAPYRLVFANGLWYVAAGDVERAGLRFFRMDRVLDATLTDEPAPAAPPELTELLSSGDPFRASDEVEVSVRYSRHIAQWIVERTPDARLEDDGSAVVAHRVADPRWLVRHVLQYGGEARVDAPAVARGWVEHAARQVLQTA
jgi:predicted DNA-binding transcriptional regulator YafY